MGNRRERAASPRSRTTSEIVRRSDPPQRTMRPEFRNFAGRFFADVYYEANRAEEGSDHDERDEPGWNMSHAKGAIEIGQPFHRVRRVEKNFRDPRHEDHDENENVIAFQAAADRFQF